MQINKNFHAKPRNLRQIWLEC